MLLFWGAVVAFGVWAVLRFSGGHEDDRARQILRERFARGEIDQTELQARLQALDRT
jgi:putative membrane protein